MSFLYTYCKILSRTFRNQKKKKIEKKFRYFKIPIFLYIPLDCTCYSYTLQINLLQYKKFIFVNYFSMGFKAPFSILKTISMEILYL